MKFATKRNPAVKTLMVVLMAGAAMAVSACSSEPKRVDAHSATEPRANAVARATENEDSVSYVTTVSFDKGSSALKADSKEKLDALVSKAKNTGKVDDIKIISWADMAYPANPKKSLPNRQEALAEKRSDRIKDYLTKNESYDVDTFNMAKKPSKVSELFNTENARVKRSLNEEGISENGVSDKTGKAMVLVILKDTNDSKGY